MPEQGWGARDHNARGVRVTDDIVALPPGPDGGRVRIEDALRRAVVVYTHALRLSCQAAHAPQSRALANEAITAHVVARAWAEEAVRRAARG